MERRIYESWAFTENEMEKYKINKEILKELQDKYKICKLSDIEHKEPTQEQFNNNDIIYSRKACYHRGDYKIYKCPNEVSVIEMALICDDGNLCFGYTGNKNHIEIFED